MYGCLPCPKCYSKYRVSSYKSGIIKCDDCTFEEPITKDNHALFEEYERSKELRAGGVKFPSVRKGAATRRWT